ncbi:MAG: response regulator [Deltaproteobacteria bacterium]|nr:response regulator [Deltaproteobacteria bacterium]
MSRPLLLLVDDDADDVTIALRAIGRAGLPVEVETCSNGREALEALHLSEGGGEPLRPQVIFLDLRMPQVDGFEVLRRLRDAPRTRGIPVVVISSSQQPEDVRRSYELGANSYLVKRIDPRAPGAWLAEAARYWMLLNQHPE